MKIYRNLSSAVVEALQEIFEKNKYADKVIEKILKSNPKWGARDRRFIAETIYDIVRWHRLFKEIAEINDQDYWKFLGVWCLWNNTQYPDWEELVAELQDQNIRVMTYVNPYLADVSEAPGSRRNLFQEAKEKEFLITRADGSPEPKA